MWDQPPVLICRRQDTLIAQYYNTVMPNTENPGNTFVSKMSVSGVIY
jgi:hypothetical protein